jgi:peptidoglycan/LPS O-acetylase OafA/YrhL
MVFLQHTMTRGYKLLPIEGTVLEKFLDTISDGPTGVSIFFTLSGFLITYLLIAEHKEHVKISLKNFYLRRVLRIWPLYFLVVAIGFIYPIIRSDHNVGANIFYHISFLSNFDVIRLAETTGKGMLFQNITWSVSIEEQFYVFWPLIFAFLPKRWWLHAILAVIGGSIAFRVIHSEKEFVLYFHTASVLVDLGIGGLMAYLVHEYKPVRSFFEHTSTRQHALYFLFAALMMFGGDRLFPFRYGPVVAHTFSCCSFVCIICAQALTRNTSVMELKHISFLNRLGKYTYCIYLIHPLSIIITDKLSGILHFPLTNFLNVLVMSCVAFMITLILSKLSYTFYESKFLLLKNRFTDPKPVEKNPILVARI